MATTTNNWLNPPRAKVHPLRAAVRAEISGAQVEDTFQVAGRKYTLRTLWSHEETWADGLVGGQNLYQTGRSRRAPYVAVALQAIDGVSVRELYQLPDDAPEDMKSAFAATPRLLDEWRWNQIYLDLTGEAPLVSPPVLNELWGHYQTLEQKRAEALEAIGPLSNRTGNSESSPTSSPVKGS